MVAKLATLACLFALLVSNKFGFVNLFTVFSEFCSKEIFISFVLELYAFIKSLILGIASL